VDERGFLTKEVGEELQGKSIFKDASSTVEEMYSINWQKFNLFKRLKEGKKLLDIQEQSKTIVLIHKKTKETIISRFIRIINWIYFARTVDQWFCRITPVDKKLLLNILNKARYVGSRGDTTYKSVMKEIGIFYYKPFILKQN